MRQNNIFGTKTNEIFQKNIVGAKTNEFFQNNIMRIICIRII